MGAARRSGLKMLEIDRMAEIEAIRQADPSAPIAVRKAPHLNTTTDLGELWKRFAADIRRTNVILADENTGIEVIAWIANWQASWCRFWAERHPDLELRKSYATVLNYNLTIQQPRIRKVMQ